MGYTLYENAQNMSIILECKFCPDYNMVSTQSLVVQRTKAKGPGVGVEFIELGEKRLNQAKAYLIHLLYHAVFLDLN